MNRLQAQWQRLFLPAAAAAQDPSQLVDAQGQVRALVLELARPADWALLSQVWRGAQADLQLPAPAIAVSGVDGYQLWLSLVAPVSVAQAHGFLAALCARYLPEVAPARMRLWPVADASAAGGVQHARPVPTLQLPTEVWSAFVAPDLAPVFVDTPWLDFPPSQDGQADVLARIDSITPEGWRQALACLQPATPVQPLRQVSGHGPDSAHSAARSASPHTDPRHFLLAVMNDEAVDLALRIEAAKALLPYPVDLSPT
jgi:hypothetical protein